jgi:hypothetical protein
MKRELYGRARDKEPSVRKEVVGALSILQVCNSIEFHKPKWNYCQFSVPFIVLTRPIGLM